MKNRLSNKYNINTYEEQLEENLFDSNTVIEQGFFLEVYINPEGKDSGGHDGTSYFIYIDKDVTFGDIISKFSETGGKIKNDTMQINIIPADDPDYKTERDSAINFSKVEL